MMKIVELNPELKTKYEDFLNKNNSSLVYYSLAYKNFLERLLGCQSHYLLALVEGEIKGVLPLMIQEGKLGKIINSLPYYGSNGGILAEDKAIYHALVKAYEAFLLDHKIIASTLVTNPLIELSENELGRLPYDFIDERIGQWKSLEYANDDELMFSFESSTRRNIRKAIKEGVTVEKDPTAFDFLRDVHQQNIKAIGGIPKTDRFFSIFSKSFLPGENYDIYVAKKGASYVAALLVLYYNRVVEYFTPAIVEDFRSDQPLALTIYHTMQDAITSGYRWWNWGGTWLSQEGVYRFKKKWGSLDKPYYYYTKIFDESLLDQDKEFLLSEYPNFFVLPFNKLRSMV